MAAVLLVTCFSTFSVPDAAAIVYSGYDIGSTSLAGSPNATTAAAAFDTATGSLSVIDFESGLPAGVSVSGGGVIGVATSVCATPDLHCYATSPDSVLRNNGAIFDFVNPIDSFGAYFLGWQLAGQSITAQFLDGSTSSYNMPAGNSAGGTLFFGLTEFGSSITSISYFAGSPDTDAIGIDDVRYGTASVVPIPAAVWLFGTALIGLVGFSKRSKAA